MSIIFLILSFLVFLAAISGLLSIISKNNAINKQNEKTLREIFENKITQEQLLASEKSQKEAEINQFYAEANKTLQEKMKKEYEELARYRVMQLDIINQQITEEKKSVLIANSKELSKKLEESRKYLEDEVAKATSLAEERKKEIEYGLQQLMSMEGAARTARIREYEEKNKEDFYKIILEEEDLTEIEKLEEIVHLFRNSKPIRKAIYEIYYKNPVSDLIKRVTEGRRISGIYKITHMESGMCYIGQSVDIGNRWLQHIKRGSGADEPTGSKLYPAMSKYRVYSFKFEIIEEVDPSLLSVREKYWGEYFGSKIFGFSIKN